MFGVEVILYLYACVSTFVFLFLLVSIFSCLSSIRARGCEIRDFVLDLLSVLSEVVVCTFGLRSLSHFGFIYVYFLGFATWEAMPRARVLKRGFYRSERFSFGLLSCNYFEK